MDNRGVTPVVEKLLTIGIVVLFIGAVTAVLFGGAVPDYRDAVGSELGQRVVVTAAERIEAAVPPEGVTTSGRTTVELPETIRGEPYVVRTEGETLVLDHPNSAIRATARLSVPDHVTTVSGSMASDGPHVVVISPTAGGVAIRLGGRR